MFGVRLIPDNRRFYNQFSRSAALLVKTAEQFAAGLQEPGTALADAIKNFEHEGDRIAHETMEMLHTSFITPLDRGDIRRLTFAMDDVFDLLNDAARSMCLYEIHEVLPGAQELAAKLVETTRAVQRAIDHLPDLRRRLSDIMRECVEINRLENDADHAVHMLVARLFKEDVDPLLVLKWKEIIDHIEDAIDRCEDVANIMEGILLENA